MKYLAYQDQREGLPGKAPPSLMSSSGVLCDPEERSGGLIQCQGLQQGWSEPSVFFTPGYWCFRFDSKDNAPGFWFISVDSIDKAPGYWFFSVDSIDNTPGYLCC